MDSEEAAWLAEMIQGVLEDLDNRPGMTIEVEDRPEQWMQIIPQAAPEESAKHIGYLINLPFRLQSKQSSISTRSLAEISLPAGTELLEYEPGSHITLWIPPDAAPPLLADLCIDILTSIVGARDLVSVNVQFEYGL